MLYNNSVDLYEACLKELNQDNAPSFEIDDFVHLFNRAIEDYSNHRYKLFELTQQSLDDLSVLKRESSLELTDKPSLVTSSNLTEAYAELSDLVNYKHATAVIAKMEYVANKGCNVPGDWYFVTCKRLDSDKEAMTLESYYHRPTPDRPYYKIVNQFASDNASANQVVIKYDYPRKRRGGTNVGAVSTYVKPTEAIVHYLKTPERIKIEYNLTTGEIDTVNTSVFVGAGKNYDDVFPDYVWNEMIKLCVTMFLEQQERPRVNTYPIINRSIN